MLRVMLSVRQNKPSEKVSLTPSLVGTAWGLAFVSCARVIPIDYWHLRWNISYDHDFKHHMARGLASLAINVENAQSLWLTQTPLPPQPP